MTRILNRVPVSLAERSYEILIGQGLLQQAGALIEPHLKRSFVAIVTDENVAKYHLKVLESALAAQNIAFKSIILPAGESLIWALAKESNKFDRSLRYPGEDGDYEKPKMDALGL